MINIKGEYDDSSMMRERLALFVFAALMPAPQAAHAQLTVNGESRGVFTLREVWDKTAVAAHFSEPFGPLYRVRPPLGTDPYAYVGDDPASYVPMPWERHIDMAARGDEVVPPFVKGIQDPFALETYVNVDDLIDYCVASTLTMTTDGLVGSSGASDHFEYFDPQTNVFNVLPWDPDNTFGSQGETPEKLIYSKMGRNKMTMAVRDRSELRHQYEARIAEAMATVMPLATLQAKADAIYAQIKDAAHADTIKMFPNDTFDWNLTYLKDFAAARYANLHMQIGM
jgi:spore coat protein CotH